jgi:sensor domain CHASE-containing protein
MAAGILSKQTASSDAGYDYDQEQTNIELDRQRSGTLAAPVDLLQGGTALKPAVQNQNPIPQ